MIQPLTFTREDLQVLYEEIDTAIEVATHMLKTTIDEDRTPETVEEFLELVAGSSERLTRLEILLERVKEALDAN
jgi:uncharacterized protein Yka (UPF0111/DUF47 family)